MMSEYRNYLSMNYLLKSIFGISILVILTSTFLNRIDYQDSWILNGIELQYVFFIASYFILFLYTNDVNKLLILSIISRFVLLLIPNIKYEFFLGRSMDQHIQYLLSRDILQDGIIGLIKNYVNLPTGRYYIESPLFHTSITSVSIATGLDLITVYKYFPIIINILYPLYFYSIIDKLNFKNVNYIKYSIFLTSLPLNKGLTYIVTGAMFVFLYLLGLFNQYLSLIKNPDRVNYIVFILLVIGSTMSHPIETLNFLGIMMVVSIVLNYFNNFSKDYLIRQIFIGLVINLSWVSLREMQFSYFTNLFRSVDITEAPITPTFFILLRTSVIDTIKVLVSRFGSDMFFSVLIAVSFYYLFRKIRENNISEDYRFISIFFLVVAALTFTGFILGIAFSYFARTFRFYYFIIVIFSGYLFNHIKDKNGKLVMPLIFVVVLILSSMEFYSAPILTPSASIIFPVAEDTPIVNSGEVNSIYQREMISYTYNHFEGRIACDAVTRNQVMGLTDPQYFSYATWFYPPNVEIYPGVEVKEYDVFMIHLPGISGSFEETALVRDRATILDQIYREDLDLVYSNSQSFVLYNGS